MVQEHSDCYSLEGRRYIVSYAGLRDKVIEALAHIDGCIALSGGTAFSQIYLLYRGSKKSDEVEKQLKGIEGIIEVEIDKSLRAFDALQQKPSAPADPQ